MSGPARPVQGDAPSDPRRASRDARLTHPSVTAEPRPVPEPSSPAAPRGASRARRSRRLASAAWPVALSLVVFLVAWQAVVVAGDYPPFILPGPLVVGQRFARAWADGQMWPHVSTTLLEIGLGFAIGAGLALLTGVVLARSRLAERLLSPYLVAAQATPILALAPLIALWFGTGLVSKVVITTLIVFFPVAVATMVGLRSVDPRLLEMARSFRATSVQLVRQVEIPAALPAILGGMRVGVTLAVIGAVIGEWVSPGPTGLGVLINLARGSLFDIPLMFSALATLALVGVALYLAMILVERRLVGDR